MSIDPKNIENDCFPFYGNEQRLLEPIALSEIDEKIGTEYERILRSMMKIFEGTSDAPLLQANRGRLSVLLQNVRKSANIGKSGDNGNDLETIGDLRRLHKKVQKNISDSVNGDAKHRDRRLHSRVAQLVQSAAQQISAAIVAQVTKDNPPQDEPAAEKTEERAGKKPKNHTDALKGEGAAIEIRRDSPNWIQALHPSDAGALVHFLAQPLTGTDPIMALDVFLQSCKSPAPRNLLRRQSILRSVSQSLKHEDSSLYKWLKANNCGTFFGLSFGEAAGPANGNGRGMSPSVVVSTDKEIHGERIDDVELQPLTMDALAKMQPADVVRYVDAIAQESWGEEPKIQPILDRLGIPRETFRSWREQRADFVDAAMMLKELNDKGEIESVQRPSDDAWRILFGAARRHVAAEIESGSTVWSLDELDVAYELQMKDWKLWGKFEEKKHQPERKRHAPSTEKNEETHPSTIGFTDDEIVLIPMDQREQINLFFGRLSFDAKNPPKLAKDVSEDDASTFCEIARILYAYEDKLQKHFMERVGVGEKFVWKVIKHHNMGLLNKKELAAMAKIAEELAALKKLKREETMDEFEDRKIDMMQRVALYRRLARMEHGGDLSRKMEIAADILDADLSELGKWEHKRFKGFSNHDLCPDLFPADKRDEEPDDERLPTPTARPKEKQKNVAVKKAKPAAPAKPAQRNGRTSHRNIFEATAAGGDDFHGERVTDAFLPTDAMPGSMEKTEVVRSRLLKGLPPHHPDDRVSYDTNED